MKNHRNRREAAGFWRERSGGFKARILLGVFVVGFILAGGASALIVRMDADRMNEYYGVMTLDSVQKNMMLTDQYLDDAIRKVKHFNVDVDLHTLVLETAQGNMLNAYALITRLQHRYFDEYDDLVAANITSSAFISSYRSISVPYAKFCGTPLYAASLFHRPNESWMPTESLANVAQLELSARGQAKERFLSQQVFSYARQLTASTVVGNQILTLPSDIERPYLVLNFSPALFSRYFNTSLPTEHSFYFVSSEEAEIVSASSDMPEGFLEAFDFSLAEENRVITQKVDGVEYMIGVARSCVTPWLGAIVIPSSDITGALAAHVGRVLLIMLGISLFVFLLAVFYFTRMARPIETIASAAGKGSFAELSALSRPGYPKELGVITSTLQTLNAQVEAYARQNREIAAREQQSTIRFLESQLNPHFLRNTLSHLQLQALSAGQDKLASGIQELGDILQYALDTKAHFVYLYQDIDQLKRYVSIMQARHETAPIRLYFEIDPDLYECIIPKMLLQPFVENSILHGFSRDSKNAMVRVRAEQDEAGRMHLYIEDNGRGIDPEKVSGLLDDSSGGHIGCANANQRIKLLYGPEYGVEFLRTEYTVVHITMPCVRDSAAGEAELPEQ